MDQGRFESFFQLQIFIDQSILVGEIFNLIGTYRQQFLDSMKIRSPAMCTDAMARCYCRAQPVTAINFSHMVTCNERHASEQYLTYESNSAVALGKVPIFIQFFIILFLKQVPLLYSILIVTLCSPSCLVDTMIQAYFDILFSSISLKGINIGNIAYFFRG